MAENGNGKILIVDDDAGTRKTLSLILTSRGYGVETAATGRDALQKVKQTSFDVALVDLRLPDLEGVDLVAPFRQCYPDMVIIMATAYATIETAVEALNQGASAYIQKPLRMDDVLATIQEALEKQRLAREKRQAEQALVESETRYRNLVELSPDAIAIESRGRFAFANRAAAALLGMNDPLELVGKRVSDFVHEDYRDVARKRARQARRGRPTPLSQEKYVRLDGTVIDVEVAAGPATHRGKPAVLTITRDITDRKRAEEELWRSTELFERTFMNQRDAIILYDAGEPPMAIDCNPAALAIFGYPREEIVGKPPGFLLPSDEDYSPFEQQVRKAVQDTDYFRASGRDTRRRDGSVFPADLYIAPLKDKDGQQRGWVGVVRDVTERSRAEEALRESEARFRELAELLPGIVFELDAQGTLTFVNRMASEAFGYSEEDFERGVNALDLVVPEDRASVEGNLARAVADEEMVTAKHTARRRDGTTFPVITYANRVVHAERGVGVRGIMIDLTDQKQLEATMRHQDRLAAVGRLAGGIAHDFNNYLTTIILYAQGLLNKRKLPAEFNGSAETILEQAQGAARLVRQLLDFSRTSTAEARPTDLSAFVENIAGILRRTLPEDINLRVEAGGGQCVVNADVARVEQMLMNLALNARDAMPRGGDLRLGVSRVELGTDDELPVADMARGPWVCLTVSDTGTGLSEEARYHLFEPFFTTKEPGKGTGLGLSQVYGIVRQHGGHITVESAPDQGTAFRVYLPAREGPGMKRATQGGAALPRSKRRAETVLIVEDEEAVRDASRELLESLGYRVLTAADGREALDVYGEASKVDLVLTDLVMPKMRGLELVTELRSRDPRVKALAMTGYSLKHGKRELREAGIIDVVEKPFDAGILAQAVRQALDTT